MAALMLQFCTRTMHRTLTSCGKHCELPLLYKYLTQKKSSDIRKTNAYIHDNKHLIKEYAQVLNCDPSVVMELALKESRLVDSTYSHGHVTAVMTKALEYGYTAEDICKATCWFRCSTDRVQSRLHDMERYKIWGLATLCRPEKQYQVVLERHKPSESIAGTRLGTLASLLDCSTDNVRNLMKESVALRRKPLYILVKYITMMKQRGFTSADITQDLSIFRRNLPDAIERIHKMDKANFRDFRKFSVSLLSCPRRIFDRAIENYKEDVKALDDNEDIVGYVTDKLGCSRDDAVSMYKRCPGFRNRPSYMRYMFDLLIDDFGIPHEQLRRKGSLLNYSLERHRRRLGILQKLGVIDDDEVTTSLLLTEEQFTRRYLLGNEAIAGIATRS